jgi:hypothetical protein
MRPPLLLAVISALALCSCFSPGDGQAPPLDKLYFPTGLTLDVTNDPKVPPRYMYVASSDFDLQYRSSSLVSYDLVRVREVVPRSCSMDADCSAKETCDTKGVAGEAPTFFCMPVGGTPCGKFGEHSAGEQLLYPGRCDFIDPKQPQDGSGTLLVDSVGIGAFATDLIIRANPVDPNGAFPERLFLPVRGDATLHWIDLKAGKFSCGQNETDDHSCNGAHRAGNTQYVGVNDLRQPAEPFGVDATNDGAYVAVTNQTTGSVSLFSNDWSPSGGAKLESILSGLPSAPVAIAAVPPPVLPTGTSLAPAFLVAYRNAPQIDLLRVRFDQADTPDAVGQYPRYVLTAAGTAPINANSLGFDSRGIVVDTAERDNDYENCAGCSGQVPTDASLPDCADPAAFLACAQQAHQPTVYVANRAPSSLLVGGFTPNYSYLAGSSELPAFIDSVPLTSGPSRVVLGQVKIHHDPNSTVMPAGNDQGEDFDLEQRVFIVCFDSRRIFVYDPKRRVIDAIIVTGRGPFALAIDEQRGLGYVAHFTDSYLGVISLDQRFPQTYASVVASIGAPSPPRASK